MGQQVLSAAGESIVQVIHEWWASVPSGHTIHAARVAPDRVRLELVSPQRRPVVLDVSDQDASIWFRSATGEVYSVDTLNDTVADGVYVHVKPAGFVPTPDAAWPVFGSARAH